MKVNSGLIGRLVTFAMATVCICLVSCTDSRTGVTMETRDSTPTTSVLELEAELSQHTGPVLVEFVQDAHCAQCNQMRPTMDRLRDDYGDSVEFRSVNYFEGLQQGNRYRLYVCPTYLVFVDGQITDRADGPQPYPILATKLNDILPIPSDTGQH